MSKSKKVPAAEVLDEPIAVTAIHPVIIHQRTVEETVKPELVVFDAYESRYLELKEQYGSVTINGIEDTEGYNNAKIAVRELRTTRTGSEQDRKDAKQFYLDCGRAIDKKAAWIEEKILELEVPIKEKIKAVDEEKDRIRVERIEKEKERLRSRVALLGTYGAVSDGADIKLDELVFSNDLIREMDEDYFQGKVVPQFKEIFFAKEQIRIAAENARAEEQRLQEEQKKELERQQQALRDQQAEIDRQNRELEKKRFAAIAERTKKRSAELEAMGMKYSFQGEGYELRGLICSQLKMQNDQDEEWAEFIYKSMPVAERINAEIKAEKDAEQDRLNKEAIEREENRKRQEDELRRQQERQELIEGNDLTRWLHFLKMFPKESDYPQMESYQYKLMVDQAKEKVAFIQSLKATRKGIKSVA
jgi:hypothetical protein